MRLKPISKRYMRHIVAKTILTCTLGLSCWTWSGAQTFLDKGKFSASIETNNVVYVNDEAIGAEAPEDRFGSNTYLKMDYGIGKFSAGLQIETYLPALYNLVLHQNSSAVRDALNAQQQMVRKRARPKILMAKNYDDAISLYERYKENLLGVISDVGFVLHKGDDRKNEKIDAGVDLCRHIKADNPKMPFLMQSSQESMKEVARQLKVGFLLKSSKTLTYELGEYIEREFGFGDFILTDPKTGAVVAKASDLCEFEKVMQTIPDQWFTFFSESNYLSKWLFARGLFSIGKVVRGFQLEDFSSAEEHRRTIVSRIHDYRVKQGL